MAEDVARKLAKTKPNKDQRAPLVIVLGSLYEEELSAALSSRVHNFAMERTGCARRLIQEQKLPPREYLHSTAAAWIARQCGAQFVVISGWEEGEKEGQRRLNVALVRAEKAKLEGNWTAEVNWDRAADSDSLPVAAAPSELPPEWRSLARAGKDGISVPECVSCPNPQFTDEATRAKTYRGNVVLRVVVTAEGDIGHAELVEGAAFGLNDQAIRQVRKWKLKAAQDAQGNAVAAWTTIEVTFHSYGSPDENREVVAACEFCPSPRAADCTPKKVASPVVLRTLITAEGRATNVKVIKGIDACLDQKAIEVVRTWKFRPLPRAIWTTIEINFREK